MLVYLVVMLYISGYRSQPEAAAQSAVTSTVTRDGAAVILDEDGSSLVSDTEDIERGFV